MSHHKTQLLDQSSAIRHAMVVTTSRRRMQLFFRFQVFQANNRRGYSSVLPDLQKNHQTRPATTHFQRWEPCESFRYGLFGAGDRYRLVPTGCAMRLKCKHPFYAAFSFQTHQQYYRDRSLVSFFFVCCTIPVILLTPTIAVTIVSGVFGLYNKVSGSFSPHSTVSHIYGTFRSLR